MTEEKTNNPTPDPQGQSGEGLVDAVDYDKLSDEEFDQLVGKTPKPAEPEQTETTETEDKTEPTTETKEELPDYVKGKTAEQLAKDYVNLRKKLDEQGKEVGELRTFKQKAEELDKNLKDAHLNVTTRKLINKTVKQMTQEQKDQFYTNFSEDPAAAIIPFIEDAIKPVIQMTASQANQNEINRLKELHKGDRVPFDLKEVNQVLKNHTDENGRNELFDLYGSRAFEVAYKEVKANKIESVFEQEKQEAIEKAKIEAEEAAKKRSRTYVERQGVTNVESGEVDLSKLTDAQWNARIGKPVDEYHGI
jgi:hypothetical protein